MILNLDEKVVSLMSKVLQSVGRGAQAGHGRGAQAGHGCGAQAGLPAPAGIPECARTGAYAGTQAGQAGQAFGQAGQFGSKGTDKHVERVQAAQSMASRSFSGKKSSYTVNLER